MPDAGTHLVPIQDDVIDAAPMTLTHFVNDCIQSRARPQEKGKVEMLPCHKLHLQIHPPAAHEERYQERISAQAFHKRGFAKRNRGLALAPRITEKS